jgi:hypothetical protein
MIERRKRIDRIVSVEKEFLAAIDALALLGDKLVGDPSWGDSQGWKQQDARNLSRNLESTYLIRLFAEFESGLRSYWELSLGNLTHPPAKDLLDSVARRRSIPQDWLDDVQEVRRLRNSYVHEKDDTEVPIPLVEAKRRLCRYFSRLPEDW